jgi:hypothetical protein
MKKLLSLLVILAAVSACSAKQEEPVVETGFQEVSQVEEKVAPKPVKKAPVVKKKVVKPAPVVEYKQDEKQMIEELKERFKEVTKDEQDVIIIEQEPETVEFSQPVNSVTAEDEGLKVLETLAQEQDQELANKAEDLALAEQQELQKEQAQQALTLSDAINVEEKDSFKEEQEFENIKKLIVSIFIVIFLIACLVIGLKRK